MCIFIHAFDCLFAVFIYIYIFKRMNVLIRICTRYNFASCSQEQVGVEVATEPGMPMDSAAWHVKRGRSPIKFRNRNDRTIKAEFTIP